MSFDHFVTDYALLGISSVYSVVMYLPLGGLWGWVPLTTRYSTLPSTVGWESRDLWLNASEQCCPVMSIT